MEQLKGQLQELKEVQLQLEEECVELDREIERHEDGGRACAMARNMNQRIIKDDEALPHFTRASQNIAAAVALLWALSRPTTSEDHWTHHEIRMVLEHLVA